MPDYLWTDLLGKPAQRGCESWLNLDEPATVPFAVDNLNDPSLQIDILSRQRGELSTPQPCPVRWLGGGHCCPAARLQNRA